MEFHKLSIPNQDIYNIQCNEDNSFLLKTDTTEARILLYQRLLYSKRWSQSAQFALHQSNIPESTYLLLKSINFERLTIEQEARRKNLANHLKRVCPSLEVIPLELLRISLQHFVDSNDFWIPRGRTLAENFCLFVYHDFSFSTHDFEREVVKLSGIVSSFSADCDKPSPWKDQHEEDVTPHVDGASVVESFTSKFCMIDENGNLPDSVNINQVSRQGLYQIIIAKLHWNQIILLSLRMD